MVELEKLITNPRKMAASYAELCPWFSLVTDNLVLTTDGMLLAGFKFNGMDADGKTDESINKQINIIERCLNTLDANITVWSYLDRKKGYEIPKSEFNNWYASQCHDQLTRNKNKGFSIFEHTLFIGYKLPNLTDSVISKMALYSQTDSNILRAAYRAIKDIYTGKGTVAIIKSQLYEMYEAFSIQLDSWKSMTSNIVKLERLTEKELLGALHRRMNPATPGGPIKVPKRNWFLPSRMTSDTMVRVGNAIKFVGVSEEKYIGVLSVIDEPEEVCSVHIDSLLDADVEYTLCQTFEIIEQETAKKLIQSHEQYYKDEAKDLMTKLGERLTGSEIDKVDTGKLQLADQASEALADLTTKNLKHGFHSSRLVIYSSNLEQLRNDIAIVAGKLRVNGYSLTLETTGLFGAWLSTFPGNNKVNPRKYLGSVEKVADLLPMRGKYEGEKYNNHFSKKLGRKVPSLIAFATESGVPFQFNFHVGDVGHTIVVGGTGAGKTTLINLAITEFQKYSPCKTYIFDKDYSMSVPALLLGGKHIDGGKTNALGTNPIRRFIKDDEINQAVSWVCILLEGAGQNLKSEEKELISKAIQFTQKSDEINWHILSIYTYVRGYDQKLASRFLPFIDISEPYSDSGKGLFSGYFDSENDKFELTDILCFECSKIIKMPEISSAFLYYITYCIEKKLDGKTPTLIFIEECWYYFKNPAFAEILEDWARTLRKKMAFLVMVTQGAKELKSMPSGNVIIGLCPTKIFLPIITDMTEDEKNNYIELFGLNEKVFEMIDNAIPKRDYIIKQPGLTKVVTSRMPELTLASNDACGIENIRNEAIKRSETEVNWIKGYIEEVLNVSTQ